MERPDPEDRISAYEFLLSDDYFRGDMNIPPRGQFRMRPAPDFDDDGEPEPQASEIYGGA